MGQSPKLLELSDVTKRYPPVEGTEAPEVLKGISLTLAAGESVAIVGPSGSGKSTLLNIIGALDRPTSGRVLLDGRDLAGLDDRALAGIRAREIGFVFQLHHLLPQCTVLENVLLPTLACPGSGGGEGRARELLERVGLGGQLAHRPGQLSGGQRQRAAVVRALINRPKLVLADEPTGSLDRASADDLVALLVELNREQGVTLIAVTHSVSLADHMASVGRLADGRIEWEPRIT